MKDFTNGTTIRFITRFNDSSGTAFDPSSTWGRAFDSNSTVCQSFSSLTRVSTGVYTADWQTDPSSVAFGPGAFEGAGRSGVFNYVRREQIFRIV